MNATILILAVLIFAAAVLYSSVGHAGSSGYLTIMALMGIAPEVMKPTALMLNILVAVIASVKFYRVGYFSWSLFLPLAITSLPCSFIGGYLTLPASAYNPIMGSTLLLRLINFFALITQLQQHLKQYRYLLHYYQARRSDFYQALRVSVAESFYLHYFYSWVG